MKTAHSMYLAFCLGGAISVSSPALFAGTASSVLNFTTLFAGGGCGISAPPTIQFNNGNPLLPSEIEAATEAGTPKTSASFNIMLSNCSGWGLIPKIKVTGDKTTAFGSTLFRSNQLGSGDSDGYGVYLKTDGNTSFKQNNNLGYNGTISANENWSTEKQLATIDTSIPIFAVLRCGNCVYGARQGGKFSATVTFTFLYD